jgi:predicted RND superfamily exporter protein
MATKKEAAIDMLNGMWKPVVMTSVTTAVGFISLLTSEVYPIKYFGLFTAFGVLSAMVLSLVLIPAGLMIFKLPKPRNILHADVGDRRDRFADRFAGGLLKNKFIVLMATIGIIVISIVGIQKVWINSSFLDKFEKDSDIVLTDKFINENFGGTSILNLVLESNDKDAFKNPETLKLVDEMQNDVESLDIVGNSFSLSDYLKRMNKVMNADDEAFNTIPDSPELIAQYLLLYEISGDPENLWEVTDYEFRKLNITFQIKSDNSKEMNRVIDRLKEYRNKFAINDIEMNYAGSGYKALVFTDLILEGQIKSLLMSLVIVVILLSIMFKRIGAGLIGSVPIIITSIISFGVMGLLNIPLSTTTALMSSIAIGIGIDYAVHFIDRYKINLQKTGDLALSVNETMHHSGRAILFNAVVVIVGFLVLLFSVFPPNRELGALVSLNMFTSFVGTLTIMVLLIKKFKLFSRKDDKND